MRASWRSVLVLSLLVSSSVACKEEAKVKVSSLSLEGVHAVEEAQLRAALQTKAGSWMPFSKKPAFDTDEFQRDLQRLRQFYTERGYPDARVTNVDVAFDEKKEHVRLTVTVREGEPMRVESMRFEGFEVLPERRQQSLKSRLGLAPGDVRDRRRVDAARDHGAERVPGAGLPVRQGDRGRAARRRAARRRHRGPRHAGTAGDLRADRSERQRLGRRGRHPAPARLQARRPLQRRPRPRQPEQAVVARSVPLRLCRAARAERRGRRSRRRRCPCASRSPRTSTGS